MNFSKMTIKENQEAVVNEFAMFDEWMDKYAYLIDLGKDLPVIQEQYKTIQFLISGCQSRVWLHAELVGGKVVFTAKNILSASKNSPFIDKNLEGKVYGIFANNQLILS